MSRCGLSPAVMSSCAATSGPTPVAASRAGATWRVPVGEAAGVLVAFTDGLTLTWLVHRDDDAARAVARAAADALSRMAETP